MKKYIRSNEGTDKVQLYVEWYPYDRGETPRMRRATVSANNMLEALANLISKVDILFLDSEGILAGEYGSPEEVLEEIMSSNGDGCDYIVLLQNKSTGETLIDADYEGEYEDWDE